MKKFLVTVQTHKGRTHTLIAKTESEQDAADVVYDTLRLTFDNANDWPVRVSFKEV